MSAGHCGTDFGAGRDEPDLRAETPMPRVSGSTQTAWRASISGCGRRAAQPVAHRAHGVRPSDLFVAVSLNLPSQKRDLLPVIETAAAAHVALRGMSGSLTAYLSFLRREDAAALELAPACRRKTASPAGSSPTRTTHSRTPGQAIEPWVGVTASVGSDWLLARVVVGETPGSGL